MLWAIVNSTCKALFWRNDLNWSRLPYDWTFWGYFSFAEYFWFDDFSAEVASSDQVLWTKKYSKFKKTWPSFLRINANFSKICTYFLPKVVIFSANLTEYLHINENKILLPERKNDYLQYRLWALKWFEKILNLIQQCKLRALQNVRYISKPQIPKIDPGEKSQNGNISEMGIRNFEKSSINLRL